MSIKEQAQMTYTMWKMNCPVPIAYRFLKAIVATTIAHIK